MAYDSDYSIRLAQLKSMGGDTSKHYDSVYDIDLEILRLTEGGPIQEVSELPEASENKGKIVRLSTDGNVYIPKLLSSETITTNRLPDEQQIDKAYLYETQEDIYYYKGAYKIICSDGEISGYLWGESILSISNAVEAETSELPIYYIAGGAIFDDTNRTITADWLTLDEYKADNEEVDGFGGAGVTPISATYNAPEANQIGNATLAELSNGESGIYNGQQITFEYNNEQITGYKWFDLDDDTYCMATDKPASEIYFYYDEVNDIYYTDTKLWYISLADMSSEEDNFHTLYIPPLNAPDSEQVDNAWIKWNAPVQSWVDTYYYIGTLTALDYETDEPITLHAFQRSSDDRICGIQTAPSALYTQDYSNIPVWSYNNADYNPSKWVGEDTGEASGYSTVKYQREETIEEWDWANILEGGSKQVITGTADLIYNQDMSLSTIENVEIDGDIDITTLDFADVKFMFTLKMSGMDMGTVEATGAYNKYTFNASQVSSSVCRFTIPFFNIVTQTPDMLLIDYDTDTTDWSARFLLAS